MKPETKHSNGRPTKYQPQYAEQAKRLCLLGLTDAQLASFFEVSEQTINNWKKEHSRFSQALKQGKAVADAEVAHSLYQRAIGFTVIEQRVVTGADGPEIIEINKEYPPDVQAQRFWLKNRQPHLWRDNVQVAIEIDQSTTPIKEELDAIYSQSMEKSRLAAEKIKGRGERLGITLDKVSENEQQN